MPPSERENQFAQLLKDHFREIFGFIYALIRNYTEAEDVMQQTSMVLWNKFDSYRSGTNFVTWACSVARLEALNYLRKRRRYQAHFSEAFQQKLAVTLAAIPAEETQRRAMLLEECLNKLPEVQRQLLQRCLGGESTVSEVALETRRTVHSIYSSLRNIRNKLLDCVDRFLKEAKA
jgi:RNA polymerase sigma-70 factor, ECF subfamily